MFFKKIGGVVHKGQKDVSFCHPLKGSFSQHLCLLPASLPVASYLFFPFYKHPELTHPAVTSIIPGRGKPDISSVLLQPARQWFPTLHFLPTASAHDHEYSSNNELTGKSRFFPEPAVIGIETSSCSILVKNTCHR